MSIVSQEQYEINECARFYHDLNRVGELPLHERQENRDVMVDHVLEDTDGFWERVGFLIDGNYGYGSYLKCKEMLSSKMNRHAWIFTTLGALEYSVDRAMCTRLWKSLKQPQQEEINKIIDDCIESHKEGQ